MIWQMPCPEPQIPPELCADTHLPPQGTATAGQAGPAPCPAQAPCWEQQAQGEQQSFHSCATELGTEGTSGTAGVERTESARKDRVKADNFGATAKHTYWQGRRKAGQYLTKKADRLSWEMLTALKDQHKATGSSLPFFRGCQQCLYSPTVTTLSAPFTSQVLGFVTEGSPGEPRSFIAAQTCKTHACLGCCH